MKYFTSDWHLYPSPQKRELMNRRIDDSALILGNLLHTTSDDVIYHLGDVIDNSSYCHSEAYYCESLSSVCNYKELILIRGNHDRGISDDIFYRMGFTSVIPEGDGVYEVVDGINCYLTHYPTRGVPDAFNLVGHIHSAWKVQKNMYNVGVDVNRFSFVDEKKVSFIFNAINSFYDEDVWCSNLEVNTKHAERGKKTRYFS